MKLLRKIVPCLTALGLFLMSGILPAATAADPVPVVYSYVLELSATQPGMGDYSTNYDLFVVASEADAPALHAGSIALAVDSTSITATLESVYETHDFSGSAGIGEETIGSQHVVEFTWNARENTDLTTISTAGKQRLASVTIGSGGGTAPVGTVELLSWDQTSAGKAKLAQMNDPTTPDKPALENLIKDTWRYEDLKTPDIGYYQGFYAADVEGADSAQFAVDIQNGWQAFRIVSYNPYKDTILEFYAKEDSGWSSTAVLTSSVATPAGQDPGKLTVEVEPIMVLDSLPAGTYKMVIKKASHVTVTYENLIITDSREWPQLIGKTAYLPCGDLNGDNKITLIDFSRLTNEIKYGRIINNTDILDLDGDEKLGQKDLAILIDPHHYGKHEQIIDLGGSTT